MNRVLSLSSDSGENKLSLGTLISTSPSPVSQHLILQNHNSTPLHLQLTLSENLCTILTLQTETSQPSLTPFNQNFLYNIQPHPPETTLLPHQTAHLSLQFLPHPCPPTPTLPSPSSHTFNGHLHAHHPNETNSPLASLPLSLTLAHTYIRPETLRLDYGHCPRSVTVHRTLTIANLTPIPTTFALSTGLRARTEIPNPSTLRFLDHQTGLPLNPAAVRISASQSLHIRVALRVEAAAKQSRWFALENLNNPMNIWHIRVFANTRSHRVAQTIQVDCPDGLDFADCFAHCRVFRDVTLKNNARDDVSLTLLSNRRQQISYQVVHEWSYDQRFPDERMRPTAARSPDQLFPGARSHARRAESPLFLGAPALGERGHGAAEEAVNGSDKMSTTSSSSRSAALSRSLPTDSVEQAKSNKGGRSRSAEHVVLAAGQVSIIRVWYLPLVVTADLEDGHGSQSDLDRGRLRPDTFQLVFKLPSEESRVIEGRARVCESILRLERDHIHLGDCNVLAKYQCTLSIINCSDLAAPVTINYVSQCVVAREHEMLIKPRETFDLELDFTPRQVNPNYHKEITITNGNSPHRPNLKFTLRANCVDRQGISLHALFYKILAPNATNEIDFGVTVANHAAIRAFRIRNITKRQLTLKFDAGQGVKTYMPSKTRPASLRSVFQPKTNDFEELLGDGDLPISNFADMSWNDRNDSFRTVDALVDGTVHFAHGPFLTAPRAHENRFDCVLRQKEKNHNLQPQELGYSASRMDNTDFDDSGEVYPLGGERSWLEFLKCLDERDFALLDSIPMFFSNHDSEISYTERQFRPARRLRAALRDGYLLESNTLTLAPEAESLVVVSLVLTDAEVRGRTKTRPFEKKLIVHMLEFDNTRLSDAAATSSKELNRIAKQFEDEHISMPREILLTVQACKSRMKIAPLRQLNFGTIQSGVQKHKAFSIVNLSEAPLLYALRKEGSRTSDELRFNLGKGTLGVVRPYFSKVVPFIYAPMSEGYFEEHIIVENRLDKSASCELVVKAVVVAKPSSEQIEP